MGKDYVCNKCGYKWTSRKGQDSPAYCPRCASKKIEVDNESEPSIRGSTMKFRCSWCGNNTERLIQCFKSLHWAGRGIFLCKDCATKCKKCDRYYCPKHIKTHNC